jgi:hypothetical protein
MNRDLVTQKGRIPDGANENEIRFLQVKVSALGRPLYVRQVGCVGFLYEWKQKK